MALTAQLLATFVMRTNFLDAYMTSAAVRRLFVKAEVTSSSTIMTIKMHLLAPDMSKFEV